MLVDGSNFYCGNSSGSPCQLALKNQIPSAYIHPSAKQCNYSVDLSNYVTKDQLSQISPNYTDLVLNKTVSAEQTEWGYYEEATMTIMNFSQYNITPASYSKLRLDISLKSTGFGYGFSRGKILFGDLTLGESGVDHRNDSGNETCYLGYSLVDTWYITPNGDSTFTVINSAGSVITSVMKSSWEFQVYGRSSNFSQTYDAGATMTFSLRGILK